MKRVMIVGQPGSGKSTLARKLAEATGLPVTHMDHIHWKSGWVPRDEAEKLKMARDVMARDEWIFEGGFSRTFDERASRADTLIWLDVGVWRRLWRVTHRFVRYFGQSRPDLPTGCNEGNWREMWDFYKWIWNTRHTAQTRIKRLIEEHGSGLEIVVLNTIPQTDQYVERIRARTA